MSTSQSVHPHQDAAGRPPSLGGVLLSGPHRTLVMLSPGSAATPRCKSQLGSSSKKDVACFSFAPADSLEEAGSEGRELAAPSPRGPAAASLLDHGGGVTLSGMSQHKAKQLPAAFVQDLGVPPEPAWIPRSTGAAGAARARRALPFPSLFQRIALGAGTLLQGGARAARCFPAGWARAGGQGVFTARHTSHPAAAPQGPRAQGQHLPLWVAPEAASEVMAPHRGYPLQAVFAGRGPSTPNPACGDTRP